MVSICIPTYLYNNVYQDKSLVGCSGASYKVWEGWCLNCENGVVDGGKKANSCGRCKRMLDEPPTERIDSNVWVLLKCVLFWVI